MVGPLVVSLLFWIVGFIILIGQWLLVARLKTTQKKLEKESESAKFDDNSASIAFGMGETALDVIPWDYIRLCSIITGVIIIALGFVPLGFLDL